MIKCVLCDNKAKYRDKDPIINKRTDIKTFLHYCENCCKLGLEFGFLEKKELEKINQT